MRRERTLSLSEQMEELYCVSIDGQRESSSNERDVNKMKHMLSCAMNTALTEKQFRCLSMYYFEHMTMKEIAEDIGIHPSTVCRHVKAARVKLQKLKAFVD